MVRLGGLTYAIEPARPMGRRIRDIRVGDRPLDPARRYKARAGPRGRGRGRRRWTSSPRICAASGACASIPAARARDRLMLVYIRP